MSELTPIELECNMGKDANGVEHREPCKAYDIDEVDAAIAELEDKLRHYPMMTALIESGNKEIAEIKAENRKLKRALWLARAERAKEMCQRLLIQGFNPKWEEVERKCRAKAKEYK